MSINDQRHSDHRHSDPTIDVRAVTMCVTLNQLLLIAPPPQPVRGNYKGLGSDFSCDSRVRRVDRHRHSHHTPRVFINAHMSYCHTSLSHTPLTTIYHHCHSHHYSLSESVQKYQRITHHIITPHIDTTLYDLSDISICLIKLPALASSIDQQQCAIVI